MRFLFVARTLQTQVVRGASLAVRGDAQDHVVTGELERLKEIRISSE